MSDSKGREVEKNDNLPSVRLENKLECRHGKVWVELRHNNTNSHTAPNYVVEALFVSPCTCLYFG